jgi:methylenetetrahydrofolate reductase (NADPH)
MDKLSIQNIVKGYSIETTVRDADRVEKFADHVPAGTCLYIPHVPGANFQDTVLLAARLRKEGMEPVPHIVARRTDNLTVLDDHLRRLTGDAGVKQVLVVAGDNATPVGELESGLQILDSGLLQKYQIRTIGVAGHPEGHRDVKEPALRDALRRKNAYAQANKAAVYVVTQFTFSADPIVAWEASFGADIGDLPVTVGLPGLASAKTLLKFAIDCGVGNSLQAFSKRAASFTKLLTVSTPDDIIVGLARYKDRVPHSRIAAVHFFPFGGFKRTAEWANAIVAGTSEITADDGLRVAATALQGKASG